MLVLFFSSWGLMDEKEVMFSRMGNKRGNFQQFLVDILILKDSVRGGLKHPVPVPELSPLRRCCQRKTHMDAGQLKTDLSFCHLQCVCMLSIKIFLSCKCSGYYVERHVFCSSMYHWGWKKIRGRISRTISSSILF